MRKPIVPIILVLVSSLFVWYYIRHPLAPKILLGGRPFIVELAVSIKEKERGLGYRDALPSDQGMLFVYDHPEQYAFWMKGMRFPLDIIWIRDLRIVDMTKNVPVASTGALPLYKPSVPADKVLEVNAGTIDRLGLAVGDSIQILKR